MKALLLSLALLGGTALYAHQGEISSTLLVERADGAWELHLVTALTAFQYEIQTHYGPDAYATPEAFEKLVADHLSNTVSVRFNGGAAALLTSPRITLGHETRVAYTLANVPDKVTGIEVTNTAFADIHHNRSALVVVKPGSEKQQFALNADNQHTARLTFGPHGLRVSAAAAEASVSPLGLGLLAVLGFAGLTLAFLRTWRHLAR